MDATGGIPQVMRARADAVYTGIASSTLLCPMGKTIVLCGQRHSKVQEQVGFLQPLGNGSCRVT